MNYKHTPQPSLTPERDELWAAYDSLSPALCAGSLALAGKLERERNELAGIISTTLQSLPVGYLPNHTATNLPAIVISAIQAIKDSADEIHHELNDSRIRAYAVIGQLDSDNLAKEKLIAKLQNQLTKALEGIAPSEFPSSHSTFKLGQLVRKKKGSQWSGKVVGFYSTELTAEGYAVESSTEIGSVQIYPCQALESLTNPK